MRGLVVKVRAILNRPRVVHYVDVFVAAFVIAVVANKQHILDAHGLNAWKAVVEAAAVTGGKAVLEVYRKSVPSPPPAK